MDGNVNADVDDHGLKGGDDPQVDVPPADLSRDQSNAEDHPAIARLFVVHVVVWNLVVLLCSLGALFIYFEDAWTLGGQLIGVGLALALYGVYRWPDTG